MPTAVVTGAGGFIGRYVARCLSDRGYEVIGIGRTPWSAGHEEWGIHRFVCFDLTRDNLRALCLSPDVLVHCAGASEVGRSFTEPHVDFCNSALTASAVLDYVRSSARTCRIAFASSASVYGVTKSSPITEDVPVDPISPYGHHKAFVERLAAYYSRDFELSTAVVRLFSVYGIGLRKQLFWDACGKLARGERAFHGTGEERRDWLHVSDAAGLLVAAAENATTELLVLNGGSGTATSVKDALNMVTSSFGGVPIQFTGATRRGDPTSYVAGIGRAMALGWQPHIALTEGLAQYVDHYKRTQL